jgi:ABC-2 type transport system ATP-binding protein
LASGTGHDSSARSPVPAIDVRGLVKRYGDRTAVDGLDLRVPVGQVHGLVGPNGAGKTTVLRALFGLVRADAGTVTLFGRRQEPGSATALEGVAGFVESPRFYPYLSARTNLAVLARLDGGGAPSRVDPALEEVGLADRAGDRVGGFSVGMRQRLGIAAALVRAPRLLVLDEPVTGLDPAAARDTRALLRRTAQSGATVLLSSHDMLEVEDLCQEVTVLAAGALAHRGTVAQLRELAPPRASTMTTSDDDAALALAPQHSGVDVTAAVGGGLRVTATTSALDAYVLALGRAGVAVRRLETEGGALEALVVAAGSTRRWRR